MGFVRMEEFGWRLVKFFRRIYRLINMVWIQFVLLEMRIIFVFWLSWL